MGAKYEIWLTDDAGKRLYLFTEYSYFSYARSVKGLGTIQLGIPFTDYLRDIPSVFQPDWRLDVWRSPDDGVPARREGSFLLLKYRIYTRKDEVKILELFGRSPIEILRRQYVTTIPVAGLTDEIDDMMKYVVTNYVVNATASLATVPTGELVVDGNSSDGPSVTASFLLKNVLDVLTDLRAQSESLHRLLSTNKKIYFDLVEDDTLVTNGFGFRFQTFPVLRGSDRTQGIEFSLENGNIVEPVYYEDYLDIFTSAEMVNLNNSSFNASAQSADRYLSRWMTSRLAQSVADNSIAINQARAYTVLKEKAADKKLNVGFVNSPGSPIQPRSLYGLDWDMGDLLPVSYAGRSFQVEVLVVYVSVNDQGDEKITGRSALGE